MLCPNCNASLPDGAAQCPNCGLRLAQPPAVPARPEVKDYLTVNIVLLAIAVLCCNCTPALATGVLGVVFASQVKPLIQDGKLDRARSRAKLARNLAIATGVCIGLTVLFLILYFALFFGIYGVMFFSMLQEMGGAFGALCL